MWQVNRDGDGGWAMVARGRDLFSDNGSSTRRASDFYLATRHGLCLKPSKKTKKGIRRRMESPPRATSAACIAETARNTVTVDKAGRSPLHHACAAGDVTSATALLQADRALPIHHVDHDSPPAHLRTALR